MKSPATSPCATPCWAIHSGVRPIHFLGCPITSQSEWVPPNCVLPHKTSQVISPQKKVHYLWKPSRSQNPHQLQTPLHRSFLLVWSLRPTEPYPLCHGEPQTQRGLEPIHFLQGPTLLCVCGSPWHTVRWCRRYKSEAHTTIVLYKTRKQASTDSVSTEWNWPLAWPLLREDDTAALPYRDSCKTSSPEQHKHSTKYLITIWEANTRDILSQSYWVPLLIPRCSSTTTTTI